MENPFGRRFGDAHLYAIDAMVAVVMALAVVVAASETPRPTGLHEPLWLSWFVGLAVGLPIAVRRKWPMPAFTIVFGIAAVATTTGIVPIYAAIPVYLAVALMLYTVTVVNARATTALAGCLIAVGLVVIAGETVAPQPWDETLPWFLVTCATFGATWAFGVGARQRRAYAARATERAVAEERLRIARELHDVVAHGMSMIAVKAGIANHVAEDRPEEAREALRVIERTSRDALTEMRRLLGVLRAESDSAAGDAELAPAPGVADLPELADRARMAGVPLALDVRVDEELPEAAGLTVYRIVQEALTNVVKHAAPARCAVSVVADGGQVRIEVTDDGPGTRMLPGTGGGHGLIGMRERVMMYDGTFTAGPRPKGGFAVTARIPYQSTVDAS
ncbi:sensor histidine kinase [Herbihabitans rhizosphaerae]|uniref:sensor histidine kinase n=1 Tax=Herbihabitans rhizosphaerae TaxID=1872711 RepID=UPI001F5F3EC8|nr:sensor histidine kinase [Herbihabitans rhizosphaerae]